MPSRLELSKARQVQARLAARVREENDLPLPPRTVCGLDVAYAGDIAIGAAVLLRYRDLTPINHTLAYCKISVPYIPTFLSFREYPPLSLAFASLSVKPDLCFVDAHGRSHPRRIGAACHFGVLHDIPTIGVAKRLLCGTPQQHAQSWRPIVHQGEIVGAEVITKSGVAPIYVSVGHRITLETAIELTRHCTTHFRLPEPIRQAHNLSTESRRKLKLQTRS